MMIDGTTGNDSLTGTPEADWIHSYGGRDTLLGGAGDDVLHDNEDLDHVGDDSMFGEEGNDSLHTYRGDDTLDGGEGEDTAFITTSYADADVTLDLSTGAGVLAGWIYSVVFRSIEQLNYHGGVGLDSIIGGTGGDLMHGGGGDDVLQGGDGDDALNGDSGNDSLSGGAGNDILWSAEGDDTLDGGEGEDSAFISTSYADADVTLDLSTGAGVLEGGIYSVVFRSIERLNFYGGAGQDSIIGTAGGDMLKGGGGDDVLQGGDGDDSLFGGSGFGDARLSGGAGNDFLSSQGGNDTLDGGDGVDIADYSATFYADLTFDLAAGTGRIIHETRVVVLTSIERLNFYGSGAQDRIAGAARADTLYGAAGDDRLVGRGGDDYLTGASGNDSLLGGLGKDKLNGNTGDDRLGGAGGNDVLIGFVGDDTLWGGQGHDRLNGGAGQDVLTGGAGHDWFTFYFGVSGQGWDTITDFDPAQDTIRLQGASLAGLGKGVLPEGAFAIAADGLAQAADDRILYDSTTGALYWDTDGAGGADAVQFAQVQPGLALTAADFVLF
ncbi:MAG: calcium-binding protein [Gemmobacter sp.]|nr:calcium-binding protein [Gemmobacter sp.]